MKLETLIILIPALPLAAALVTAALGKVLLGRKSHWPAIVALIGSFFLSLCLVCQVHTEALKVGRQGAPTAEEKGFERIVGPLWTWASVPGAYQPPGPLAQQPAGASGYEFLIDITLRADPLTAIMLAMVTFVSSLVAIYSMGYMRGDPGYWRFYTYVSLFVFSMTMLVSVSNFVLLYVFWEAVGACSYLLIGFWFQKPEAAAAGKKAFLVNRVGDFGFALAVFLIWTTYGTFDFHDVHQVTQGVLSPARMEQGGFATGGVGLAICLLLFVGACGKSAQFPLHVWLPDAMEGPTPVSALIHAATMVTAGVYLVARCAPMFLAVSAEAAGWWADPLAIVAIIGCFTALLAGLIAVTQTDLKRVLAYSTVSQLGFMFLGLGTGTVAGTTAGMFHLFTHAFFKALLFLGAGSVMHAMHHVIDMRRFSGLRRILPVTHATFLFGSLALAGVVPFAGFWSKDAILAALHERAGAGTITAGLYEMLFWAALSAAGLTSFYTFRAFFLTFYGKERVPEEAGHHAHESPRSMTVPLMILAFCALTVGAYFDLTGMFAYYLQWTPSVGRLVAGEHASPEGHYVLQAVSTLVALSGLGLAAFLYLGERRQVDTLARLFRPLYELSYGKFFFDQIYQALVVWPVQWMARASYWIDRRVIDAAVNLVGRAPVAFGSVIRALGIGLVQFYALAMVLGLLVLLGVLLRWPLP